jgi:twitching motility protein PilT
MSRLDQLFGYLKQHNGSDLHLAAGLEPRVRLHGELRPVPGWPVLDDGTVRELMRELVSTAPWREFETSGDLDFAHGVPGVARFRVNYFLQHEGAAAVFRLIPEDIIPIEDLLFPPAIAGLADLEHGLVLVTGPTGSGKSTTLAAIIDRINRKHRKHIITIEDPVEFVHVSKQCVLSQREVGGDTESFGAALRAAIREDADVVMVGEMRDLETISLAITAAEMGSLVFGTLHTNGAANTIDRLIDSYPAEEQSQIRTTLSESLAAVVSQILLRSADDKGRCAAVEILLRTAGLPNVIREGNTPMITSIIQGGRALGMQLMDDSLASLVESKRVTAREAYLKATNKARFEKLVED